MHLCSSLLSSLGVKYTMSIVYCHLSKLTTLLRNQVSLVYTLTCLLFFATNPNKNVFIRTVTLVNVKVTIFLLFLALLKMYENKRVYIVLRISEIIVFLFPFLLETFHNKTQNNRFVNKITQHVFLIEILECRCKILGMYSYS